MSAGVDQSVAQLRRVTDHTETSALPATLSSKQKVHDFSELGQNQLINRVELSAFARRLLVEIDFRVRLFKEVPMGDATWCLLLELYIDANAGRDTTVSNACLAARIPSTTALRILRNLEENELIERKPDRSDRRRIIVKLTPQALSKIELCLFQMA